ncbi:MAG: glycerol dehydrogenase [Phycisphaerales bacterium]|nr:glycerol dehydrogenase [Phycisphaerales bacterium]
MVNTVYASASRYTQGTGATASLPAEMAYLGLPGPVAIVSGPTVKGLLGETWATVLGDAGVEFSCIPFAGECSRSAIAETVAAADAAGAGVILGAGGGKVLDTARATAATLDRPFICCPTVASTDSPCSALAVIYSEEGIYEGFESFGRNPDLVLVDTEVISKGPVRYFVAGMGDALSTVFEARACRASAQQNLRGGLATIAAVEIGEACYRTIMSDGRTALADMKRGEVTEAFERVVEANTLLSGIGFESAGLAAAHGLHNAMTGAEGTHSSLHGEKVAFGVMVHLALEEQPAEVVDDARQFCLDVGLPVTLEGVGLSADDETTLRAIAERAVQPGGFVHNEPFSVSAESVYEAILSADRLGRAAGAS